MNDDDFYIVGIGASAGGLEALRPLISNLPADANKAYVVVQHTAPDKKSLMIELLSRETGLPVQPVVHGLVPEKNTIYVTPANHDVIYKSRQLLLAHPSNTHGPKPSIDRFFLSLSHELEEKCIAVVLSGTGSDGARGIEAVKTGGGITLAQDPESAAYDSMPNAAIRIGGADFVMTPDRIGQSLEQIIERFEKHKKEVRVEKPSGLEEIIQTITDRTGIDFKNYKIATLERQVIRRITALQLAGIEQYARLLEDSDDELRQVTQSFLISVTGFFRDKEAFETLSNHLDELLEVSAESGELRIWVAACSTGEEVYSIAILVNEKLEHLQRVVRVQIFATDINQNVLNVARAGAYSADALSNVDDRLVEKYFDVENGVYQVKGKVRDRIIFAKHDVVTSPPFSRLDMICCRNLLIYFKSELQTRVLRTFHYALKEKGLLFLGKSESIGNLKTEFAEVTRHSRLFRKRVTSSVNRPPLYRDRRPPEKTKRVAPSESATGTPHGRTQASIRFENAFAALTENYVPPAVLITDGGEILEFFGDCSPFLKVPTGKANFSLFNLLEKHLSAELRAVLRRVIKTRKKAPSGAMEYSGEKRKDRYRAVMFPAGSENTNKDLFIVAFENIPARDEESAKITNVSQTERIRTEELESELHYTRENLQTVIEEFETANEELQAMNEEAQASNEELQASNEELATANEELQASNEELISVNDELNLRTRKLARLYLEMQNVLNSIQKAIIVTDRELVITRVNQSAHDFFDLSFETGENLLAARPRLEIKGFADVARKTLETNLIHAIDPVDHDGRTYVVRFYPFVDASAGDQRAAGLVVTIQDISEKANAMRNMEEAKKEAELANNAKSVFLANVSHEIRTPLSGIIGYSELLLLENPSDSAKDRIEQIYRSSTSLLHILNDILDHSKIESGRLGLEARQFGLRQLVETTCNMLAVSLEARRIELVISIHDDVPDALIGDSARLAQVLNNLVSNASKFTDAGRVEVSVEPAFKGQDSTGTIPLRFAVSDTGIGLSEEQLNELFQPFKQADETISRRYGGTGLGLSICKSLVELMGGSISVESQVGRGSVFRFTLPFEVDTNRRDAAESKPASPATAAQSAELHDACILIAEDNPINAQLLQAMLKHLGLRSTVATSGTEALSRIRDQDFSLVFMDMQMPEMDGLAAARSVRDDLKNTELPILAMTANSGEEYREQCLSAGMNDYLSKPVDLATLRRVVAQWVPGYAHAGGVADGASDVQ